MTTKEEETKERLWNRLRELCKDLEFVVPQLDEPTGEQQEWINRK